MKSSGCIIPCKDTIGGAYGQEVNEWTPTQLKMTISRGQCNASVNGQGRKRWRSSLVPFVSRSWTLHMDWIAGLLHLPLLLPLYRGSVLLIAFARLDLLMNRRLTSQHCHQHHSDLIKNSNPGSLEKCASTHISFFLVQKCTSTYNLPQFPARINS